MFSFTEFSGQSSLDKHGTVEIHSDLCRRRRPAWLVLLKVLGVASMVAVGFAIAVPTLRDQAPQLPMWKGVVGVSAAMLLYTAIAFFIRPECNGDNMGWLGGSTNDPTQYSDNINRLLWKAHMVLGPGRFTAETLFDACVLLNLVGGKHVIEDSEELPKYSGASPEAILASAAHSPPSAPDRYVPQSVGQQGSSMQLDSWKYFQQQS
jgi:hypothetical protein